MDELKEQPQAKYHLPYPVAIDGTHRVTTALDIRDWVQRYALPFWAKHGRDEHGGYERLFMDGRPDAPAPRRARVQARQAYVYAHAAALNLMDRSAARKISDHFWNHLVARCMPDGTDGGCVHVLTANGDVLDARRDLYDQAFVIFAGAWRFRAFGDEGALRIAHQTVNFIDSGLAADNRGWLEDDIAGGAKIRRQNSHMHLFEAFLALYAATNDAEIFAKATDIADLFADSFFDPETGGVFEFLDSNWQPMHAAAAARGQMEPGHMMEWCYLLRHFHDLGGADMGKYCNALYRAGLAGINPKTGLLRDMMSGKGADTHRLWPQTEFLRASTAQMRANENVGMNLPDLSERILRYYLYPVVAGGWVDTLNSEGEIISSHMPASTFYHLFGAIG